jgi:general secretion pathway protein J
MSVRRVIRRNPLRGFTLLEVLVVMALLSVVMLALGSSLTTVSQAEQKIDERMARMDAMRVTVAFLRATVGRASARKVAAPPPIGTRVLFTGAAQAVEWVGVMPARYGAGGRYFFRLGLETASGVPALVMRFAPWADGAGFPDWTRADSRVLVEGVQEFAIRYEDANAPGRWSNEWSIPARLPIQLQLSVATTAAVWPPINLPLRFMPASDATGGSGAAFGGS